MKFYQVSSFTEHVFGGNPAGVCLLEGEWLSDTLMQNIAGQINLSETVFVLNKGGELCLRWFTPAVEVDLCGHATLAAAFVLFGKLGADKLTFKSQLHTLPVENKDGLIVLDFPMAKITRLNASDVPDCFNFAPVEVWAGHDEYMLVLENEAQVRTAVCNLEAAKNIEKSGFIITAESKMAGVDFVSRYFAPKIGINEDPVTGSAHTLLTPYWQKVMGKNEFLARQVSKRAGDLYLTAQGDRIKIGGKAVMFLEGNLCGHLQLA